MQVDYASMDDFLADATANISVGGMFIQTERPLAVGTRFRLRLALPGDLRPIDATGEVRWIVSQEEGHRIPGMGIRFEEISDSSRRRVEKLLSDWEPDGEP